MNEVVNNPPLDTVQARLHGDLPGGPFELVQVYAYQDEPQTYALRSVVDPDLYYVVNFVDEDEFSSSILSLAVAISADRYREFASGTIDARSIFTEDSRQAVYQVIRYPETLFRFRWIVEPISLISERWLPAPGVRWK